MTESEARKKELAEAPPGRLLLRFSIPTILGMLVESLYNIVDAIFVGQAAGKQAIAALAVAYPIQLILLAVAVCVGVGSASLLSRSLGAGEDESAGKVVGTSVIFMGLAGLVMSVVALANLEGLVVLFGATGGVVPFAKQYLEIYFLGSVIIYSVSAATHNVRAEGNPRAAMTVTILATGLNAILDPIFIFGLGMGIRGAAIATVAAATTAGMYLLSFYLRGKSILPIHARVFRINFDLLRKILKVGSSSFVRLLLASAAGVLVNNSIRFYGNATDLALLGIVYRLMIFVALPLIGIAQGMVPIVGFNYGAHLYARVKATVKYALIFSSALATACFGVLFLFTVPAIRLFTSDAAIFNAGPQAMRLMILTMPLYGLIIISGSYFQAVGRAAPAMVLNVSRLGLFMVAVASLPVMFGIDGVWLSYPVSELAMSLIAMFWLFNAVKHVPKPAELPN